MKKQEPKTETSQKFDKLLNKLLYYIL